MNPKEYEKYVGDYFKNKGYKVYVTSYSNDYGLDILAENSDEKLAIQVKKYGGGRSINRSMFMELCGVCKYFDCDRAVMVTDGSVLSDAKEVANKLNIEILYLNEDLNYSNSKELDEDSFEFIWENYIMPLKGKKLEKDNGKFNTIKEVDWSGIKRVTSNGNLRMIKIEIFKEVINKLKKDKVINRSEINDNYVGRASSGICLILSQVPFIKLRDKPLRLVWNK